MPIWQQYYTSCRHPAIQDQTGFQVKAESVGLPSGAADRLRKLIGYRVPSSLVLQPVEKHPIALRYLYGETSFLTCVQSNGEDEFGRTGNYFAHSLVGSPDLLNYPYAPIFYWKSPSWVTRDSTSATTLSVMQSMKEFEANFDFDSVWRFLDSGELKREYFAKLLAAVVDSARSKRRIILLDSNDSVAMWIAALSMALPPSLVRFLTFATYYHEPALSPYTITGVTEDNFNPSRDDYVRQFVLNASNKRISDAPESVYASYVTQKLNTRDYESELIEFLNWMEGFEEQRYGITSRLDDFAVFWQIRTNIGRTQVSPKNLKAARHMIGVMNDKTVLSQDDVQTILQAHQYIESELLSGTTELANEWLQGLAFLARVIPNFANTAASSTRLIGTLLIRKQESVAQSLLKRIDEMYSRPVIKRSVNTQEFLGSFADRIGEDSDAAISFLRGWASYLTFEAQTHAALMQFLIKTFAAIDRKSNTPEAQLQYLLDLLGKEQFGLLIRAAGEYSTQTSGSTLFQRLYYLRVQKEPLAVRAQHFWSLWSENHNLFVYELEMDIKNSIADGSTIGILEAWCANVDTSSRSMIVRSAFELISSLNIPNTAAFARSTLTSATIRPLIPAQYVPSLVATLLENAEIAEAPPEIVSLYEQIMKMPGLSLSSDHVVVMQGVLILAGREFDDNFAREFHRILALSGPNKYEKQAKPYFTKFLIKPGRQDLHLRLIRAVYVTKYNDLFWKLYWDQFQRDLIDNGYLDEAAKVIDCWFSQSRVLLQDNPYIVADFFLEFPAAIASLREAKGYNKVSRQFENGLTKYQWFPVVERHFAKRDTGFLGIFGKR